MVVQSWQPASCAPVRGGTWMISTGSASCTAPRDSCRRQLWLDERGTSGDLADLVVRCECGKSRGLYEATAVGDEPPRDLPRSSSLARHATPTRTAICRAGFSSALRRTLTSHRWSACFRCPIGKALSKLPSQNLWDDLQIVDDAADLAFLKKKPKIAERLAPFSDEEVLASYSRIENVAADRIGRSSRSSSTRSLAAPEGFGDDVPIDPELLTRDVCQTPLAPLEAHRRASRR